MPKFHVVVQEKPQYALRATVVVEARDAEHAKYLAIDAAGRDDLQWDDDGLSRNEPPPREFVVERSAPAENNPPVTLAAPADHAHDPRPCFDCERVYCSGCTYAGQDEEGCCPDCGAYEDKESAPSTTPH